jgi:spore cortex biosynthesis protein YabQ
MEENIQVQIYIFLFTLYGGLIIGILYDIIDILLHDKYSKTKGRGKTDILFWMLAIIVVLSILFYSNDGIIRVYTLLGFAIGWLLYFFLLSKFIQRVIHFILLCITSMTKFIVNILLVPFRWIKRLLYIPYIRTYKRGSKVKSKLIKYSNIPKIIIGQFNRYKKYLGKFYK